MELYVFLIQFEADYLLIDAGPPGEEYADLLLKGLQKKIGTGHLRLVVLTHGHIDHVGGLPALKRAFPDAHVAFHTEESPYLTGQPQTSHLVRAACKQYLVLKQYICQTQLVWDMSGLL